MPLYYQFECPRGHEIYGDDLGWCPTCEELVIPLRITKPEQAHSEGFEDAMVDSVSLDDRNKDLLYGFNDDSVHCRWE